MALTPEQIADCRSDLLAFTKSMFRARKGADFVENWHHKVICEALERVVIGQCKRLIINIPPRYSKTEIAVVNFIAWCMGNWPDCEFIHTSYSARLAANNTWGARAVLEHEQYAEIFGVPKLRHDSNAKDEWRTTAGGCVYAAGAGGTITGYGAGKLRGHFGGAIIIDDPHKADEANSDTVRQGVLDWFQNTLESRCNSPDTPIIVIMQRLHEEDLSGWLLDGGNGEEWEHLCIPVRDNAGVPLWPFKHDDEALRRMETSNRMVFAGQYLQQPAPADGGMVKLEWFKRYRTAPGQYDMVVQSWDTAHKPGEMNDPSVCTTWGIRRDSFYLLDCAVIRASYPELRGHVLQNAGQHRPDAILIEDKASGQSLVQELQAGSRLPVIAIEPKGDKPSRFMRVSPTIEAGKVWLPEQAPWLGAFERELLLFPNGKHDDQVDSVSQLLNWSHGRTMTDAPTFDIAFAGDSYAGY